MTISRREVLASTVAASLTAVVGLPSLDSTLSDSSKYSKSPYFIVINGDENSLLQLSRMLLGGYYLQGFPRDDISTASEMYSSFFTSDGLEKTCSQFTSQGKVIQQHVSHMLSDIQQSHQELHPLTLGRPLTVDDYFALLDHLVAKQTRTSLDAAKFLSTYIDTNDNVLRQLLTDYAKNIPRNA